MQTFTKGLILMFVFSFAFIVIVEGAGTTQRGNKLSFNGLGVLDNINNITLNDEHLFIIDNSGPFIKAYFNLPPEEVDPLIQEEFNESPFSNTTTGFLGDVNNFDDINEFSRFRETNINNGTNASAGFIGVNDVGFDISMGIASSGFEFQGIPAPNIGVLRLRSPSGMLFLNDFITGYFWLSDKNNTFGVQDPLTTMQLDPIGNLNITRNITAINSSVFFSEVELFVKLGPQLVDGISAAIECNIDYEGSLSYSSIDQEFYGCRDKSGGSQTDFEWKKLT